MENLIVLGKSRQDFFDLLDEWENSRQPVSNSRKSKPELEPDETYFTQGECAKFLKISLPTLIKMKKMKKIPYYQFRRSVLFKKSEILEALRSQ